MVESRTAWAVVVTYHPDVAVSRCLLAALAEQAAGVVVVDNGSRPEVIDAVLEGYSGLLDTVALGANRGIAAAQNAGIARARALGASHVVLFDQDSQPAPDMFARLLACWGRLTSLGYKVASVGPCYVDDRQENPPPFIRVSGLALRRCHEPEIGDAVSVDYLISSGSLLPLKVLDEVGVMNEELFIDYVDIEWGLRARARGFGNFGCFSARMHHSLGDEPIHFRGKAYPAHSSLRHYYLFRNAILLYRMPHIPLDWKLADGWRLLLKYGFYSVFSNRPMSHLKMMTMGLVHGLLNRSGPLH